MIMTMIVAKPMFLFALALVLSSVVADHPLRAARHAVEQARLRVGRHAASLRASEAEAAAAFASPQRREGEAEGEGSAALLQAEDTNSMEDDCDASLMEVFNLMFTSGCYDLFYNFDPANITDFEVAVTELCSACDFEGVGALLDAVPMSCQGVLEEELGGAWGVTNAFCSTDPDSGDLCAMGLNSIFFLDLGEDDAVQVCEKTTCSELFFQNWVDNHLTGEACVPFLIQITQICVQVDGEYCVGRELAMFVTDDDVERDDARNLCNSECGQAFIDGIAAEYAEHEECYSEGIHTPPELYDMYCNQTADGDYCIVKISALVDEFLACPEYIPPSDYMSVGCSSQCATELEKLVNDLGCCASFAPKYRYDAPEDAETFTAWAKAQCNVDFTKCGSGEQGGCGECEEVIHHEIASVREELLRIQYEAFDEAANRIAGAMMMHGDY